MAAMEISAAPVPTEEISPANSEPIAAAVPSAGENALEDRDGVEPSRGKRKRDEDEEEEEGGGEEEEKESDAGNDGKKQDRYWKTSLCSFYRRRPGLAGCSHGDACRYAHGEAELRPRPDNTWDPTSERAKKLLAAENGAKIESLAAEDYPVTVDATSLDKCLIGLPRRWGTDNLKGFLDGQV